MALDLDTDNLLLISRDFNQSQSNLSHVFMTRSIVIYSFVSVTTRSRDPLAAILDKKIKDFEAREYKEFQQINSLI